MANMDKLLRAQELAVERTKRHVDTLHGLNDLERVQLWLCYHGKLYYVDDASIVEDTNWDAIERLVEKAETPPHMSRFPDVTNLVGAQFAGVYTTFKRQHNFEGSMLEDWLNANFLAAAAKLQEG